MPVDRELLEILACPQCKGPLRPIGPPEALACDHCRLLYPVVDGIPVMLVDEALPFHAEHPGT
ncbi:MAG: Trm112 family protein [Syntrophotalea acetylenica]|jgi:hypothetical protein|uniref:UPF0434 protein A7E75_11035 n=1 Tax=Syntrophotalea acetylenica TaxID=29542 RepID=A0A1L3GHZ3_SYNAC|nr:Trm112 family protein [Syntrophotalea acetylenica]APG25495.1 hypothetical protein A7E75_11035 [Syntrophotalea acetylenica]APG43560.1 hypothetical protein A6070_05045 [Syntrophotalea acetylenica]MDD4457672.1 Trm112 family protein [Syntrophotalea acetylenica]MDY0262066.1 Trm112 family protein [Syntrophotalea acetylenica]